MASSISPPDKGKGHDHHRYSGESHGSRDDLDQELSMNDVKAPNVFERVKEEFEAVGEAVHPKNVNWDTFEVESIFGKADVHPESHGLRDDLDEETPIDDVKAPSVFERAMEEIEAIGEAIGEAIHPKKQSNSGESDAHSESHDVKAPDVFERAKDEFEAIGEAIGEAFHRKKKPENNQDSSSDTFKAKTTYGKSDAHPESHGLRDDLDKETPIDDVKAPDVLERVKEEFEAIGEALGEAIGEALHLNKEPVNNHDSSPSHFENWDSIKTKPNSDKSDAHSGQKGKEHDFIGRNEDIDVKEVKGPSVFARAKDEFEALFGALHRKKESTDSVTTPKNHDGFTESLGKGFEKICSPKNHKHDD